MYVRVHLFGEALEWCALLLPTIATWKYVYKLIHSSRYSARLGWGSFLFGT